MQKKLILLIGIPGCGKTTCAQQISQRNEGKITHYSTGTLIRQEIERGTAVGEISKSFFDKGDLVPTQIVLDIIVSAILNAPTEIVLIAGFPGKQKQLAYFGDYLFTHDKIDLLSVLELQVNDAIGKERFLSTARSEDIFNHEMDAYRESIEEIKEYYTQKNLLTTLNTEEDLDLVLKKIDEHLWNKIKEDKKQ